MQSAEQHPNESTRLATLLNYEVLDTDDEHAFDELTELASTICGTPISLISLIDDRRQWFKSRVGLDATETPRSIAFCSHAILQDQVFEISNALDDPRFADNPLVSGDPDIRFYAGAPLIAPDGNPIGTLCVIDRKPRKLDDNQKRALEILSVQVISQMELRLHNRRLERINQDQQKIFASIAHDLRTPFNSILGLSKILSQRAEKLSPSRITQMAHGVLSSSLQLYQLLDELLQWSSSRYNKKRCDLTKQPLYSLIEKSAELFIETLELKHIHYSCECPHEILVSADATLTKTIIRNLLANAIKFTPENGLVTIQAKLVENFVELHIHNTGKPIPETTRTQLFSSTVKSESGTLGEIGNGLGLKLMQEFIEMQGGTIWLDESNEKGNTFAFSLKLFKSVE